MPRCSPRCDGPWRCTPNAITGGGARHVRTGAFRAASVYVTRRPDVFPVGWRPLRASEAPLWSAQVPSRNSGAEGAITVRTDRSELWGAVASWVAPPAPMLFGEVHWGALPQPSDAATSASNAHGGGRAPCSRCSSSRRPTHATRALPPSARDLRVQVPNRRLVLPAALRPGLRAHLVEALHRLPLPGAHLVRVRLVARRDRRGGRLAQRSAMSVPGP